MKKLLIFPILMMFGVSSVNGDEVKPEAKPAEPVKRPMLYPFDVTIGGQKAVMQEGNILFAVIEKPVKPDALLEIQKKAPMLIINAFKVKPNGAVMEPGEQPAIYFVKEMNQVKLNATMDKKPLEPGRYLINVVAHGTTSRVVFVVGNEKGEVDKLSVPTAKQVFDFLTK